MCAFYFDDTHLYNKRLDVNFYDHSRLTMKQLY